jgi:hypothetical protein
MTELLTLPKNWHPEWPGVCECGTESLMILCHIDEDYRITQYDLWVQCSWCHKNYTIPPPKEED